jgi:hypothetical protein
VLPNLIVIGAAKCGTTTLSHHLGLHPDVAMTPGKDLRFFSVDRNWERGREWYERQFPDDAPVRGEASPSYTGHPFFPDVPERMAGLIPDARLVYIVRDPIDRIESNYWMDVHVGERRPLAELVADPADSWLVARSRYHFQLERYRVHFPDETILVLDMDDLARDPAATMARVFAFVGVDPTFTSPEFGAAQNEMRRPLRVRTGHGEKVVALLDRALGEQRSKRLRSAAPHALHAPFARRVSERAVTPEIRRRLTDYLRDDVERLRAHTGLDFASWSL